MLPAVGLRVMMTDPCDGRGEGCIESVHANGGYCAVLWDSGCRDVCLFTGMQNEFHLAAAPAHPDSEASSREALPGIVHISLPAGTDSPAMLEAGHAAEPAGDKWPASATGEMGALGEHATASVQEGDTSDYFQRRILAREVIQMLWPHGWCQTAAAGLCRQAATSDRRREAVPSDVRSAFGLSLIHI